MPTPNNVHDSLFRTVFSTPQYAAGLLQIVLPPDVIAGLKLETVEVLDGAHISGELRTTASDLVLRVERRLHGAESEPVYIILAVEHQSTDDAFMTFRVLQYSVRIWEKARRDRPDLKRLPPVIPIVIHAGDTPWRSPTRFHDLLDLPRNALGDALRPHLPDFEIVLEDLPTDTTERLRAAGGEPVSQTVLDIMKRARDPDVAALFHAWRQHLEPIAREGGLVYQAILWYLLYASAVPLEDLAAAAETLPNKVQNEMMTTAEQLTERGRQEGRQEALAGFLLRQFSTRFGSPSNEFRARIETAPVADLERWLDLIVAGERPTDLFE